MQTINTPKGVAVWPKLHEPDTKFKDEGEYGVKLAFDPDEPAVKRLVKGLEKTRDEQFEEFKKEKKANNKFEPAPVFTVEEDEEGEETGRILMNFKMKASGVSKKTGKKWSRRPAIFDATGKELTKAPNISGGSVLRVAFTASGFGVPSSKLFYLSLRLVAVKVIELVEFGKVSAASVGFDDEEEGYTAPKASSFDEDTDDVSPANNKGGDGEEEEDGDF